MYGLYLSLEVSFSLLIQSDVLGMLVLFQMMPKEVSIHTCLYCV